MKKKTKEQFIAQATERHGDRYDYSKVNYVNGATKVEILCSDHGSFFQTPENHLSGRGCVECYGRKLKTNDKFIADAILVHGRKYDYSKVIYADSYKTKVTIICPEHGEFEQKPNNHLTGRGCAQCSNNNFLKSSEQFIAEARVVHGEKYDYSLLRYEGLLKKVEIVCPEHGVFEQSPSSHLHSGSGCVECGGKMKKTTERFISDARLVHDDRYDYSLVDYVNIKSKIKIICKKHGMFEQEANSHLNQAAGCPKCTLRVSKPSIKWLDGLDVPLREKSFKFKNEERSRQVDGYDPKTNTVYQFHGYFWHGHPDKFDRNQTHPIIKKSFGCIYEETLRRDQNIRDSGYNLIVCWEHEFVEKRKWRI